MNNDWTIADIAKAFAILLGIVRPTVVLDPARRRPQNLKIR